MSAFRFDDLKYVQNRSSTFCFSLALGKLEHHFSSVTHIASVDRYLNFKNKKMNIDLMLDSNRRKESQEQEKILQLNKQIVITLLDTARFLASQGLAFRRQHENEGICWKV